MENSKKLQLVYCVTSFGKLVGVYADAKEAFEVQMLHVNKGRISELVPMSVIYPSNLKS